MSSGNKHPFGSDLIEPNGDQVFHHNSLYESNLGTAILVQNSCIMAIFPIILRKDGWITRGNLWVENLIHVAKKPTPCTDENLRSISALPVHLPFIKQC